MLIRVYNKINEGGKFIYFIRGVYVAKFTTRYTENQHDISNSVKNTIVKLNEVNKSHTMSGAFAVRACVRVCVCVVVYVCA